MNTYELIEYAVKIGLLTVEVAYTLRNYLQKDDKQSQTEEKLRIVLEEALNYFQKQNNQQKFKEPFSNVNLLSHFMTTTQYIDNPTIQELCNQIMAHELVSPGVTPNRIMQILSTVSFEDMQKFQIICSMNIGIITDYNNDSIKPIARRRVMVPFNDTDEYSKKTGIYLTDINELQAIGLISYNSAGYYMSGIPCKHPLIYANGKTLYVLWHNKDRIPGGNILLTKAGECLFNVISECEIIDEYDIYVQAFMEYYGVAFAEQERYSIIKTERKFTLVTNRKNHDLM